MDLVGIARNPVPAGAVVAGLASFDGLRLRTARWRASAGASNGTVCVFTGRGEFIEKYFETIDDLRRRGFAVAIMDWRGQGGSQRKLKNRRKGHVEDFSEYERDVETFMTETVLPDCPPPYFAMAHSMGANVLLHAARHRDCWFDRMIMTAPMLQLAKLPLSTAAMAAIAEVAVFLGLGDAYIPGGKNAGWESEPFENNLLTTDKRRWTRNREILAVAPELGLGSPTIAWARAAFESMKTVNSYSFPSSVYVPILMLVAGQDNLVSPKAVERLTSQLRAGSQLVFANARHEPLQERDEIREELWAAFDAFVPGSR